MSSTNETGHGINVSHFEQLISVCNSYGAAYNPGNAHLTLSALQTKLTACENAMHGVITAKNAWDNATNHRENLFDGLKRRSTRILNMLKASDASVGTIKQAEHYNRKMHGKRAGKIETENPEENNDAGEPAHKYISVSQLSYDMRIEHLKMLVIIAGHEPSYHPNETELSVAALNAFIVSLETANHNAMMAKATYSNARITRNKELYHPITGLVAISKDVKGYVLSVYGYGSMQFKQINKIRFQTRKA